MIDKMTTKGVMDVIEKSISRIDDIDNSFSQMKSEFINRLAIASNELEYSMKELADLKMLAGTESTGTTVILADSKLDGIYQQFGTSIHPAWVSEPANVMNFMSAMGPIYKDNAEVTITEIDSDDGPRKLSGWKSILMHDAVKGKQAIMTEFDTSSIDLEVKINPNDLLGATSFNTIELLPYLPGSFDITGIEVYTVQDYKTGDNVPSALKSSSLTEANVERIILPQTLFLYKIIFHITLNFKNSNGKYPFGFKHIYFLNANMNPNSYVIAPIVKDKYIDWISEDIIVRDQNGLRETTCTNEDIEIYMTNTGDELRDEIKTTKGLAQNSLSRNVKIVYAKIPLTNAISYLKFQNIATR